MVTRADTIGTWNGARREMEEEGWLLARTLRDTKSMRDARQKFTPQTWRESKQVDRYNARLERSVLFPAYKSTIDHIASLPFQKEPTIEGDLDERLARIVEDADRCGTSMSSFWQLAYADAVDRGIAYVIVDNVPLPDGGVPLPVADKIDARPYLVRIQPDSVVGFLVEKWYGRDVVTEFRYREWSYKAGQNGLDVAVETVHVWTEEVVETWVRADAAGNGIIDRDAKAAVGSTSGGFMLKQSIAHGFTSGIPLVVLYTEQVGALQGKPPLVDLAWQNVAHWNAQSMQDEALHYCRSPILKITGVSNESAEQSPETGPGSRFIDTSDTVEMSFVEIAGTSLTAGERQIQKIEERMVGLGMKPLVASGGPDTATGEMRADMTEKSRAQSWVEALEWAIIKSFDLAAEWLGEQLPPDFDVTLFKESSLLQGKATDLPMLQGMRTSGDISQGTYLREVKARGVLVTVDDIDEEIAAAAGEKEASQQRQMDMLAAKMVADRPPGSDAGSDAEGATGGPGDSSPNPESPDAQAGQPAAEVTFNELTLGAERAVRMGNLMGANELWQQAAELIGVNSLGKVKKQPAAVGAP